MNALEEISILLQRGQAAKVKDLVEKAIGENAEPKEILEQGLLAGMKIVGEKFKRNEVFVPEVLIAARAMHKGMEALQPYLAASGAREIGTVIICAVKGDLHDIGKNLVRMMMEGRGIKVIDLGVDVGSEAMIQAANEHDARIIACAALLTTTMGEMAKVVDAVKASALAGKVKVMVGGAPITQAFADAIGADLYAADAASAAESALSVCGLKRQADGLAKPPK